MIAGIFHKGSGIGNQLHRYVMTRCLALDKNLPFGMIHPENFKAADFMRLDMGVPVADLKHEYNEAKLINEHGQNVADYDWDGILKIKDFTLIDGEFQGEKYYQHHLTEIGKWLKVRPLEIIATVCIINFRGGEYVGVPDLFLPMKYWDEAVRMMRGINSNMIFEVHTDDEETAQKFFPDFKIIHNPEINWRAIRYAPYLILSNSSFAILPALLNRRARMIIAPKFWAGHNKGYWQQRQNVYNRFTYI